MTIQNNSEKNGQQNTWQNRKLNGKIGEELVEKYFLEKGFSVLAKNFIVPKDLVQTRGRQEVDLVVGYKSRAYLVEVKNHHWVGSGFESIISLRQFESLRRLAFVFHRRKLSSYQWGYCLLHVQNEKVQVLCRQEF